MAPGMPEIWSKAAKRQTPYDRMVEKPPMPEGDGMTPPNLRDSGMSEESCGNCEHFEGENGCAKFAGYPCIASEVCDEHQPAGMPDNDAMAA